jgi:hypothetical protein
MFKLGDGRYCYPLTVTDQASPTILLCEALESTRELPVIEAFSRHFAECGLPVAIRSDNGLAFASALGVLAPPRHRDQADQTGQPAGERPA